MSSLGGSCSVGKRSRSRRTVSIVSSTLKRGLRQPDDLVLVADRDVVDGVRTVDQLHVVGRLARGADDLFVALVTDQQDVVVVAGEALGLVVHLGHQRAGGVDDLQLALRGRGVHRRCDAMRGEHHDRALGYLVGLVDEDRAGVGQRLDHVPVVHDLVADVHRRAVLLERPLDGLDRAVDARAVPARLGQQHPLAGHAAGRRAGGTRNPHVDSRRHGSQGTDPRCREASRRLGPMATAPYGVRLLVGAAVTAIEETRKLPQTILMYPMTVASQLAHLVMKVQQDVADLVIKGDETLESLFPPKDEQPEWATFDEDLTTCARAAPLRTASASPRAGSRCSPAASRIRRAGRPTARPVATDRARDRRRLDYEALTLAQLRARLTSLRVADLEALLAYEDATKARAPFQTLLANRITRATAK